MPGFKYHVFLSHSTPEKPAVEELAVRLRREGIEPWLDKWHLVPGELCQVVMETALTNCATCAVFIGPSGFGVWQEEEMRAAIARRVNEARTVPNAKDRFRVIPVLLPNSERPERGFCPRSWPRPPGSSSASRSTIRTPSTDWSAAFGASSPAPASAARPSRTRVPTAGWRSSTSSTPRSSSAARR